MNRAQRNKSKRRAKEARENATLVAARKAEFAGFERGRRAGAKEERDRNTAKFSAFTRRDGAYDEPLILGAVPDRPYVEVVVHSGYSEAQWLEDNQMYPPPRIHGTVLVFEAEKHVIQLGTGQRIVWYGWRQAR